MASSFPANFQLLNTDQTKNLSVVVSIPGVDYLSNRTIYKRLRYGDPGVTYGAGYVYGQLIARTDFRALLSLDGSSLTLSQRVEPEQGKASVSTLTLAFVDKDSYMTQVVSPGVIISEILNQPVTVYIGYSELSFPEDFAVIFRGRVSDVGFRSGTVTLQLSDPNINRRQSVFFTAKTTLSAPITNTATTIPCVSLGDFHKSVALPGSPGSYDSAVKLYAQIENEWIEYGPSAALPAATLDTTTNQLTGVLRGQRGTTAVSHAAGAAVSVGVELTDHAMTMALKIMLSGWGGPWQKSVSLQSIVYTGDASLGDQADSISLPSGVDAVVNYNLSVGDFVSISGSAIPGNNITEKAIIKFGSIAGQSNRVIYFASGSGLARESTTTGTASFRSQFDTYPTDCGSALTPPDVDVAQHLFLKNTFMIDTGNTLDFFITDTESSCKSFIESEVYLPTSCYSLTRQGQLSVGLTKPPIADQRTQYLNSDNVMEPANIKISRGLNSRKFFNEVHWEYDIDDSGTFTTTSIYADTNSLTQFSGYSGTLPIKSRGMKTAQGANTLITRRSQFLLSRYKNAAAIIENVKVFWGIGCQIEAGDVVALTDNGTLQIANFATGVRDIQTALYEVVDRTLDIRSGFVTLKLIAGVGAQVSDRFATVSPSSVITSGSTSSKLLIQDSFGAVLPGNESGKWSPYVGQEILVHSEDYSVQGTTTLTSIDPANAYALNVSPALGFVPPAGYVIDVIPYPNTTNPNDSQIYKAVHCFFDPQLTVVSGLSTTQFTLSAADAAKIPAKAYVRIHSDDYTVDSGDVQVSLVSGTTVTLTAALTFTPSASQKVDLVGFTDGGGAYRYI